MSTSNQICDSIRKDGQKQPKLNCFISGLHKNMQASPGKAQLGFLYGNHNIITKKPQSAQKAPINNESSDTLVFKHKKINQIVKGFELFQMSLHQLQKQQKYRQAELLSLKTESCYLQKIVLEQEKMIIQLLKLLESGSNSSIKQNNLNFRHKSNPPANPDDTSPSRNQLYCEINQVPIKNQEPSFDKILQAQKLRKRFETIANKINLRISQQLETQNKNSLPININPQAQLENRQFTSSSLNLKLKHLQQITKSIQFKNSLQQEQKQGSIVNLKTEQRQMQNINQQNQLRFLLFKKDQQINSLKLQNQEIANKLQAVISQNHELQDQLQVIASRAEKQTHELSIQLRKITQTIRLENQECKNTHVKSFQAESATKIKELQDKLQTLQQVLEQRNKYIQYLQQKLSKQQERSSRMFQAAVRFNQLFANIKYPQHKPLNMQALKNQNQEHIRTLSLNT